ncbi:hypothetical protein MKW94_007379 [Papaver nudicaule]|uniref:UV-B-induced protein At3g17800, chloroplastic n=1 Tax=Papaver nudicaule TaxID=74823 RepID=A0AA41SHA2_PAPNU|nr:hypothetical protein [Papaver nudicaule]
MTKIVISGVMNIGDAALVVLPLFSSFSGSSFRVSRRFSNPTFLLSNGILKSFNSFGIPKVGIKLEKYRPKVRASGASSDDTTTPPFAPLEFESPTGQLLSQILQTHPHLLPAAIEQHLGNLRAERDSPKKEDSSQTQNLLYKRIAEVKEKEKKKTLEEIIYCLVVQNFLEYKILMIPLISVPTDDPTRKVDAWPNQEQKLESVHSSEAFEMIQNHLSLVLGERDVGPLGNTVQISKLKLGKLYAASIMYGYFLKRVDERFQLERSMKTPPKSFKEQAISKEPLPESPFWDQDSLFRIPPDDDIDDSERVYSNSAEVNTLKEYVMHLDADTLQKYATIRSKEAVSLIERQTQALFGRPDIKVAEDGSINMSNDEVLGITLSGLGLLVLEAVAFGSFLWDAEGYVESKYHFFKS